MAGIQSFKSRVSGDFSRPNLFKCVIDFPSVVAGGQEASKLGEFTVRAANLPATQLGIVEVPYRGRVLKIAGDRTFEPWTITIMNDKNVVLRYAFEQWAQSIQEYTQNVTTAGSDVGSYFKDMKVIQYDRIVYRQHTNDGRSHKIYYQSQVDGESHRTPLLLTS